MAPGLWTMCRGDAERGDPAVQPYGLVVGVGPGQPDAGAGVAEIPHQRPGGAAVLDRGQDDHGGEQQPGDTDGDVPLAAVDFLAASQPRVGTVSAVRTDRESITVAVGRGSCPAAARAWSRNRTRGRDRGRHRASGRSTRTRRARAGSVKTIGLA